jgi:hypothetical protein
MKNFEEPVKAVGNMAKIITGICPNTWPRLQQGSARIHGQDYNRDLPEYMAKIITGICPNTWPRL